MGPFPESRASARAEKLLATLVAFLMLATTLALPASALDPRCENVPDDPRCEMDDPTTPPPPEEPPLEVDPIENISVIGCSNTNHAVTGYLDSSENDLLINTAHAGHTVTYWATSQNGWDEHYLPQRPADGYDAAWVNLCERAVNELNVDNVEAVVAKIWEIDPDIPIWISPLNYYEAETCIVTNGNQIPNDGAVIADQLVADNELLQRGPDLGPLGESHLRRDACHPSSNGIAYLGSQLIAFFDN